MLRLMKSPRLNLIFPRSEHPYEFEVHQDEAAHGRGGLSLFGCPRSLDPHQCERRVSRFIRAGGFGEGQAGDPYRTTWDDRSCRSGSGRHRRATRGAKGAVKPTTAHRGNSAILRPGAYQRTRCIGTVGLRGGSLAAPRRPTGGIQLQLHSGATRRRPAVPAGVRVRRLGTAANSPGAQFSSTPPRRHRHGVLPYRRQRGFAGVHAPQPTGGENRLTISAAQPLKAPSIPAP